jgi:hypothetical protein
MRRRLGVLAGQAKLDQDVPALLVRGIEQAHPVEVQDVEHVVGDRHRGQQPIGRGGDMQALLQEGERRPIPALQGDDLPVEHRPPGRQEMASSPSSGKLPVMSMLRRDSTRTRVPAT